MRTFILCADTLIHRRQGRWLMSNPRTRTHVVAGEGLLAALERAGAGATEARWIELLQGCSGADLTCGFFGENGLVADHTGLAAGPGPALAGGDLLALLVRRWILVDPDGTSYDAYLAPLKSVLDRDHLGSFHQRIGQYLAVCLRLRKDRWQWWHDQKYTPDGRALRPGSAYLHLQSRFIEEYLSGQNLAAARVLDFGCGNGYYSSRFADRGARVTGVDTSRELIEMARANHGSRVEFVHLDAVGDEIRWLGGLAGTFDVVFMQDVMLLLLNPEDGASGGGDSRLLASFRQVLKPGGVAYLMEPDPVFWLAGRYGDPERPFAVVTEYRKPVFNVSPLLSRVVAAMAAAGFGLVELAHPRLLDGDQDAAARDIRSFDRQFPIWDFMAFRPLGK